MRNPGLRRSARRRWRHHADAFHPAAGALRIHFGAPMYLAGPRTPEWVAREAERVRQAVIALVQKGLAERRHVFLRAQQRFLTRRDPPHERGIAVVDAIVGSALRSRRMKIIAPAGLIVVVGPEKRTCPATGTA